MPVDVSGLIDSGKWSFYQKVLIAGTALTIILDGVDNQLLGLTMASISKELSLVRGSPTVWTILMMSPVGMMIGGIVGGWFGDRIGRKNVLLLSVLAFAIPTAATYWAGSVLALAILRFLAGLGLGGAMPNATSLASEYVPTRVRPLAVTITIVCVPTGSMLASFIAGQLPPSVNWHQIFLYGGLISFVLGLLLFAFLDESPRFLTNHPHRWAELIRMLRRSGLEVPSDASFVEHALGDRKRSKGTISDLFRRDFIRDTFALFSAFFFCLLVNYLAFMVLPDALETWGKLPHALALNAMGWWSTGGIIGALAGGFIVQRYGSRLPMLAISAAAVACAFVVAAMAISRDSYPALKVMLALLGSLINAAQTTLYALAAHVYPTKIRGTGIGTAIAIGRIGNMLAPVVGYAALKFDIMDPNTTQPLPNVHLPAYFATFGVGMILVFISLALVRRHIERSVKSAEPVLVATAR